MQIQTFSRKSTFVVRLKLQSFVSVLRANWDFFWFRRPYFLIIRSMFQTSRTFSGGRNSPEIPNWDAGFDEKFGPFSLTKKFVRGPRYDLHFFVRKKARLFRLGPRAQMGIPG
jgi:hypothetical protein